MPCKVISKVGFFRFLEPVLVYGGTGKFVLITPDVPLGLTSNLKQKSQKAKENKLTFSVMLLLKHA